MKEYQFKNGDFYLDVYADSAEEAVQLVNSLEDDSLIFVPNVTEKGLQRVVIINKEYSIKDIVYVFDLETLQEIDIYVSEMKHDIDLEDAIRDWIKDGSSDFWFAMNESDLHILIDEDGLSAIVYPVVNGETQTLKEEDQIDITADFIQAYKTFLKLDSNPGLKNFKERNARIIQ